MSDQECIEYDDCPVYVPEGVGRGRGRSRGRARARGSRGGAGDQAPNDEGVSHRRSSRQARGSRRGGLHGGGDQQPTELEQVRASIAAEKRMVVSLTPSAKRLHVERKREIQAGRMMLPGAPERKRSARNPSPARGPRIFLPGVQLPAEEEAGPLEPLVAPSYQPATWEPSWESQPGPSEVEALGGPSQEGPSRASPGGSVEPQPGPSWGHPSAPKSPELPILITVPAHVEEYVVDDPASELIMSNWLNEDPLDILDSDDDLSLTNKPIDTPELIVTSVRTAAHECASMTTLTTSQEEFLTREDNLNDAALRSIAPASAYDFKWENDEAVFQGQPEVFTGTPGPTFDMTDQTSILDVFLKMVDAEFVDMLVEETNRYAQQKLDNIQKTLTNRSRLHRWTPTDRPEMYSFLAVLILQGLYPLAEEESYFKYNGYGTMPYFRNIMTYDRFILLKSLIHFADNETADKTSKTWRIDRLVDYFNTKFSSLYYPNKEIVVDESLLKWTGRLSFAQKISTKAAGVGLKTYELCESSSGYLWKCILYSGKQNTSTPATLATDNANDDTTHNANDDTTHTQEEASDRLVGTSDTQDEASDRIGATHTTEDTTHHTQEEASDRMQVGTTDSQDDTHEASDTLVGTPDDLRPGNATASIVYQLVEPLLNRGHTLIMDNFYNSPLLARCLKRQKTDVYGTLRLNREFVPDSFKTLTKSDLRQGEVTYTYCSDLMVMVWRDSSLVSMLSTFHRMRIGVTNKYRTQYKPSIVLEYNKTMGGVDRKDQFLSAHPLERPRNRVWYKKVFRRLFNSAIFNAFVIYNSRHPNVTHRRFRTLLAEDLLRTFKRLDLTTLKVVKSTTICVPVPTGTAQRCKVEGMHFPERTGSKYTRCWMCSQNKVTRRTKWRCKQCQRNFCLPACFELYHT